MISLNHDWSMSHKSTTSVNFRLCLNLICRTALKGTTFLRISVYLPESHIISDLRLSADRRPYSKSVTEHGGRPTEQALIRRGPPVRRPSQSRTDQRGASFEPRRGRVIAMFFADDGRSAASRQTSRIRTATICLLLFDIWFARTPLSYDVDTLERTSEQKKSSRFCLDFP